MATSVVLLFRDRIEDMIRDRTALDTLSIGNLLSRAKAGLTRDYIRSAREAIGDGRIRSKGDRIFGSGVQSPCPFLCFPLASRNFRSI